MDTDVDGGCTDVADGSEKLLVLVLADIELEDAGSDDAAPEVSTGTEDVLGKEEDGGCNDEKGEKVPLLAAVRDEVIGTVVELGIKDEEIEEGCNNEKDEATLLPVPNTEFEETRDNVGPEELVDKRDDVDEPNDMVVAERDGADSVSGVDDALALTLACPPEELEIARDVPELERDVVRGGIEDEIG